MQTQPIDKQLSFDLFSYWLSDLNPKSPIDIVEMLPDKSQKALMNLYPDRVFFNRELWKMFYFYQNRPRKTPKNLEHWSVAILHWLENAWLKQGGERNRLN
jgi:hypothetical protein